MNSKCIMLSKRSQFKSFHAIWFHLWDILTENYRKRMLKRPSDCKIKVRAQRRIWLQREYWGNYLEVIENCSVSWLCFWFHEFINMLKFIKLLTKKGLISLYLNSKIYILLTKHKDRLGSYPFPLLLYTLPLVMENSTLCEENRLKKWFWGRNWRSLL